jgi:hypothetical protein
MMKRRIECVVANPLKEPPTTTISLTDMVGSVGREFQRMLWIRIDIWSCQNGELRYREKKVGEKCAWFAERENCLEK